MKIKKHLFFLTLIFSICVFMFSCTNEADDPALSVDAVYRMACDAGYSKSIEEFISEFKGEQGAVGEKGDKGDKGDNGQDGIGIESATVDNDKHLILSLTNGETIDCGNISVATDIGITVGKNCNWHIDGVDTGYSALGKDGKDGKDGIDGEN